MPNRVSSGSSLDVRIAQAVGRVVSRSPSAHGLLQYLGGKSAATGDLLDIGLFLSNCVSHRCSSENGA